MSTVVTDASTTGSSAAGADQGSGAGAVSADQTAAGAAKGATEGTTAKAAEVSYTLTLPDGETDATLLERTTAIARESGLTNEQAQRLVSFASQEAVTRAKSAREAALAEFAPGGTAWTAQAEAWKAETLADPSLGKTEAERTAAIQQGVQVIDRFAAAHPEDGAAMKAFLDSTALGNRREVARFFAWLGKAASEGRLVQGSTKDGSGQKSTAEVLYGPTGGRKTTAAGV